MFLCERLAAGDDAARAIAPAQRAMRGGPATAIRFYGAGFCPCRTWRFVSVSKSECEVRLTG